MMFITVYLHFFLTFFLQMDGSPSDIDRAAAAYEAGNYSAAIGLYERVVATGVTDPAVYYNLGNAYYLDQQLGLALLSYRRAEQHLPRDEALAHQIAAVRAERVSGLVGETDWLVITAGISDNHLTLTEVALFALLIWSVLFVMLVIALDRVRWRTLVIIWGFLVLGTLALLGTRVYLETVQVAAVVTVTQTDAMSGPSADYLALFSLYEADEVRVLDRRQGWARVILADGRQGWIADSNLGYVDAILGG